MASEESIVNKIVSIDTILDVAKYLDDKREEYQRLFLEEEQINKDLPLNQQRRKYKYVSEPSLSYEIDLIDNSSLKQSNYNWFISNMERANLIKRIVISLSISYTDTTNPDNRVTKSIHARVVFTNDDIKIYVNGNETEEETYNIHSTVQNIINNCENRYNKTVKNRNLRVQSFCLSVGLALSYIIYIVMLCMRSKLPDILNTMLSNKYVIILGQWFIAAILGNVFGLGIMSKLYRFIIPKSKYSHYDKSSHKSVYVDNIEDYVSHAEVQINIFADNGKNRRIIEKIYKITSKIVLIQLLLSVLFYFILK